LRLPARKGVRADVLKRCKPAHGKEAAGPHGGAALAQAELAHLAVALCQEARLRRSASPMSRLARKGLEVAGAAGGGKGPLSGAGENRMLSWDATEALGDD
jgi:hypothetical protein